MKISKVYSKPILKLYLARSKYLYKVNSEEDVLYSLFKGI